LGFNALSIARCCRCIAVTAALVHQPATVFAQVNMMLRGDPLMVFPYPALRCASDGTSCTPATAGDGLLFLFASRPNLAVDSDYGLPPIRVFPNLGIRFAIGVSNGKP